MHIIENAYSLSNKLEPIVEGRDLKTPKPASNTLLIGAGENLVIDYVMVSFVQASIYDICDYFSPWIIDDLAITESRMRGFRHVYTNGKISIHYENDGTKDVVLLEIRGKGCRYLEQQSGHSWLSFFQQLAKIGESVSLEKFTVKRLDIAVDAYANDTLTPDRALNYAKKKLITSRLQSIRIIQELRIKHLEEVGKSVYFGRRASDLSFLIYDKRLEAKCNICWFRTELRFRNAWAMKVMDALLTQPHNFSAVIADILEKNIQFRSPNKKRSELRRRPLVGWYEAYLTYVRHQSLCGIANAQ